MHLWTVGVKTRSLQKIPDIFFLHPLLAQQHLKNSSDWHTMTNTGGLRFLSLSGELRNKVYRLLLCHPTAIALEGDEIWPDSNYPIGNRLSAQLLRTCRQIHTETQPILYGENTFTIQFDNTWGPYYSTRDNCEALRVLFTYTATGSHEKPVPGGILPHLRRFCIKIRYTEEHNLVKMRAEIRSLVKRLQEGVTGGIDHLRVECDLACSNGDDSIRWDDPWWDNYCTENWKQCVGMLRTWLGRLYGVKEVVIEGLPEGDADVLRKRVTGTISGGEGELRGLLDRYEVLERYTDDIDFCEEELKEALLAVERDDVEGFEENKARILRGLRERWEGLQELFNSEKVVQKKE